MRYLLLLFFVLISFSCSKKKQDGNIQIPITRIEKSIELLDSTKMDMRSYEILNNVFPKVNFDISGFSAGALNIKESPIFIQCKTKVDSAFDNTKVLENQLLPLYENYNTVFNDSFPHIYTIISPYNQSIMVGDNYVVIALNHYLGAEEPLYNYFPEYKRRYKESSRIGYDISEALIRNNYLNQINLQNDSRNVLSSLIYEGVIMKLMRMLFPDSSIEEQLMWNPDEISFWKNNEQTLWQYLIANDILYSTDERYIQELNFPSPTHFYSSEIAPDMIGRFIGYKIIDGYLKSVNLSDLDINSINHIFNQLPQQVLLTSGYNGK